MPKSNNSETPPEDGLEDLQDSEEMGEIYVGKKGRKNEEEIFLEDQSVEEIANEVIEGFGGIRTRDEIRKMFN